MFWVKKIYLIVQEVIMNGSMMLAGCAAAALLLAGALAASAPAEAREGGLRLAQAPNPNCLQWKMVRHCIETRPTTTVKPPKDPRNPEHDVEVTIKDVCVKWQETASCVSWKNQPGR
jgi:hypothetical protein